MRAPSIIPAFLVLGTACSASTEARAAENATGIYLLGTKTSMAGYVAPPGTYVIDLNYFYAGSASGSAATGVALRRTGNLTVEADVELSANAYVNLPIALWIAPGKVLGGNVGLGIMTPYGWKDVSVDIDARATLTLPGGTTIERDRHFAFHDSSTKLGDPILNALIGWHAGNWHWNVGALLNVPIGPWEPDSITNIAFNRWALDTSAAVTYFDAKGGHEISVMSGFTFNGNNPDTDYRTGTEFHVEWALMQHISKTFALGIVGYHYQQITGDSGVGARLGGFEGRVTGLGPDVTYTFMCGKIPVSTEIKFFHEFNAKNRVEGNAGFLTVSLPLSSD